MKVIATIKKANLLPSMASIESIVQFTSESNRWSRMHEARHELDFKAHSSCVNLDYLRLLRIVRPFLANHRFTYEGFLVSSPIHHNNHCFSESSVFDTSTYSPDSPDYLSIILMFPFTGQLDVHIQCQRISKCHQILMTLQRLHLNLLHIIGNRIQTYPVHRSFHHCNKINQRWTIQTTFNQTMWCQKHKLFLIKLRRRMQ